MATLGPYVLERELGAGGMGEVWLAHRADGVVTAPAALKLLHAHLAQSGVRERFMREGRILGQLAHPNIARLLDAGLSESGQPYLALEYVEGLPLDRWCHDQHLEIDARVKLFLQVCDAVAHAHGHLVVHRDLKPSNILVTRTGDVKLLDFGIAKLLESDTASTAETELTRMGGNVLTPEYAAPEQITHQPVTVATDVYSLGVILYLLLTGRRPYDAPTPPQLERAVLEAEPEPPSRTRRKLARDLDVIVMKALKKRPEERYASVTALADDLRRYLANEPVVAQPDSLTYRTRKYLRRNRVGVSIVTALVLGLAATSMLYLKASIARRQAEKESAQSRALSDFLQWDFLSSITSATGDTRMLGAAKDLLDTSAARINERLARQPIAAIRLRSSFGNAYRTLGLGKEAFDMYQQNVAQAKRAIDADDPDALEIYEAMTADSFATLDENWSSYILRLAAQARQRWPIGDLRRLWLVNDEAGTLLWRGEYGRIPAVLDDYKAQLEAVDPGIEAFEELKVNYHFNTYAYYLALGDREQAQAALRAQLAEDEARAAHSNHGRLGPDSSYLGLDHAALAELLMNTGRLDEADQALHTAQQEMGATLNSGNPNVLYMNATLGLLRGMQGRAAESRAITDEQAAELDRSMSPDDNRRAAVIAPLARGYLLQERDAAAERCLRAYLDLLAKHSPPDSLEIARHRVLLADALRHQGRLAEARAQLLRIPAPTVAKLEDGGPDRIDLRRAEGLLALAEGRKGDAINQLGEAAALSEKVYTGASYWTIRLR
jgi:serine/threonine protein kinase